MSWFDRFAERAAHVYGRSYAFLIAVLIVLVWLPLGPPMRFQDTWHLVINTPTTIITFLGLFLVQNQQWRDGKAMHAKLDEVLEQLAEMAGTDEARARSKEGIEEETGSE